AAPRCACAARPDAPPSARERRCGSRRHPPPPGRPRRASDPRSSRHRSRCWRGRGRCRERSSRADSARAAGRLPAVRCAGMPQERIDFAAEGLLDGLEGEQRADRVGLLEDLLAEGIPLSELRRATANGTIMFLPSDYIISGSERYTSAQLAELGGVEPEFLVTLRRAMGLPIPEPDEAVYTDAELESARLVNVARAAGISDDETIELMRVLGRALSQAAEALRTVPLTRALEPGISERELSHRFAQAVSQLYPLVNPLISNVLLLHLRAGTQVELVNAMERSGGRLSGAREVTVCFADLVGFTRLGE